MKRQKALSPYLTTSEGVFVLCFVTVLNLLSFMTLIDREPSGLAGSRNSGATFGLVPPYAGKRRLACGVGSKSQGLYVVPNDACFPLKSSLESLSPIFLVIIPILSVFLIINWTDGGNRIAVWIQQNWKRSIPVVSVIYLLFGFIDVVLISGLGIDRPLSDSLVPNVTYWLIFSIHTVLIAIPIWVYSHSLLPNWIEQRRISRARKRESTQYFIDANWRRARILVTVMLTGAVGTTLSFVFSRATPNFLFVVAIVGSVTTGPLGVVWFLMRRIREAEKELRPT